MRWLWVSLTAGVVLFGNFGPALAQDQPNVDDLNHKYEDALNQLKAAQDRKNELANENEQLKARLAELEKQLEEAKRQAAGFAEQTFYLRSHYAAWQSFMKRYPHFAERWKAFLESDLLSVPSQAPDPPESDTLAAEKLQRTSETK